jgi:triosephosphate isomerase
MELTREESITQMRALLRLWPPPGGVVEVVICPCFPVLAEIKRLVGRRTLMLGAQDLHHCERGAYTGDVSVGQLTGLVRYVIVGHSERRAGHGETDEMVAGKVALALRHGLRPIICVGETVQQREEGKAIETVRAQVLAAVSKLAGLMMPNAVFAYEPVWAEQPAELQEMVEMMRLIRRVLTERFRTSTAERVRVLYGGSVDADNVGKLMQAPGINGVLVGRASTQTPRFWRLVKAVQAAVEEES